MQPLLWTLDGNGARRRRILHVTLGLEMGGLEKLLVEFARHTDRARFQLGFVCLGGRGCLADEVEKLGWPVLAMKEPLGLRPGMIFRLARIFRHNRPHVVHTHDIKPLLYGALGARLARVPRLVHTQHCGALPQVTQRQILLANLAGRLVDDYVCVSHDSARLAIEQGLSSRRVHTIWNGIDLDQFLYRGPNPAGPVVTVARLSPEKDIETLVRAWPQVKAGLPSLHLEVAGAGPCQADLQHLAAGMGADAQVRFLGEIRDVPALLARASLFVLPSRSEGISLTLLEAMARGLPVVATRVGGNPEVVVEEQTGLLVPAGDPEALAAAMLRILTDPQKGRRLGLAGRARVEKHFDVRRMVASYQALYQKALADHRPAEVCRPRPVPAIFEQ